MEVTHIIAKSRIDKIDFSIAALPKKIGIVTTIQFLHELPRVRDYLEKNGKEAYVGGQILGCYQFDALKLKDVVDAFLYIGSGQFHPLGLAVKTGKPVFKWTPPQRDVTEVTKADIDAVQKKRRGLLMKFHSAKSIGVLMSTKKGQKGVQASTKEVLRLGSLYPGKRFYFFVCNTLDFSELENFPFIESWMNTMCPRIREDLDVLNLEDLQQQP